MEAIRRFDTSMLRTALESWAWVGLEGKTPLFTSPFGDVFLQASDGVWYLDRLEGAVTREWASTEELQGVLNTPEGQDQYLLLGLAVAAHEKGLVPGPTELYEFQLPPVLGAPVDVSNIEVMDMQVALHLSGQLHEQVKDLLPGTRISGFTIEGDTP